jgi:hypothetical protein
MQLILLLTLASLTSGLAAAQDFFPLVPGSQWLYRSDRTSETLRVEVGDSSLVNGKQYHLLRGYASEDLRVRQSEPKVFVYLDAADGQEKLLFHFGGPSFSTPVTPCRQSGKAEEKLGSLDGPIGNFSETLTVAYTPGICADTGVTREVFVPYLGLARRSVTTFIGERNFDLVYAQIGGITYLSEPSSSFTLSVTPLKDRLSARLTLNYRLADPLKLTFPSSQIYNFQLRNEKGDVVYNWSADKIFLAVVQELSVKGEQNWAETIPTAGLPAGQYNLEGTLVNSAGGRFTATAAFRIP